MAGNRRIGGVFGIVLHDFLQGEWDDAKGPLAEELRQLRTRLNQINTFLRNDISAMLDELGE